MKRMLANLITTWGGSLNDYASRSWAGLISDYYAKRWEVYIDTFIKAVGEGVEVDHKYENKKLIISSPYFQIY